MVLNKLNELLEEIWRYGIIISIVDDNFNNNRELLINYEGYTYYIFLHNGDCEKIEIKNN